MKTVGDKIDNFEIIGVKPGFTQHIKNNVSAFKNINEKSFSNKWKIFYFYPKDFTFVCPTEIIGFDNLFKEFEIRNSILLSGSTDNEFVKLAWRRENYNIGQIKHYQFSDINGSLIDQLGIRDKRTGAALRATFIIDTENFIQHVSVNNLNVGRNPSEILRLLDACQTNKLCPCNRKINL